MKKQKGKNKTTKNVKNTKTNKNSRKAVSNRAPTTTKSKKASTAVQGKKTNNATSERQRRIQEAALRRERSKKKKYAVIYTLLVVFSITAALMATVVIFFKVESITVSGNTRYTTEQIIADSGIELRMNMFNLPSKEAQETLKEKYTYIESVDIKRKLPTGIEIVITEEKPLGFVKTDNGYTIIAQSGKVLETNSVNISGMPMIKGLDVSGMQQGDYIDNNAATQKQFGILKTVYSEMEKVGHSDYDIIDLMDVYDIKLYYQDKYEVILGSESEMDYKAAGLKKLFEEELTGFKGVINVSEPSNISTRSMSFEDYRTQVQKNAGFEEITDVEPQTEK